VLINGAGGGSGYFAIQLAKRLAAHVTGVDNADKLDFMRSLGADGVVDDAALPDPVQLHAGDLGPAGQHPENRREAARSDIESVGGTLRVLVRVRTHDGYTLRETRTTWPSRPASVRRREPAAAAW
jgi:hypothetical protein